MKTISIVLSLCVMSIVLISCGEDAGKVPTEGEALKEHLLGMLAASYETVLEGDWRTARSYYIGYMQAEQKATSVWVGWDEETKEVSPEMLAYFKKQGPVFDPDRPVHLDVAGKWARLTQKKDDPEEGMAQAHFRLNKGKWWFVEVVRSRSSERRSGWPAHLNPENYWPDKMDEFFFLPPVRLRLELVGRSDDPVADYRVRCSVTNLSDKAIRPLQMKRFFTTVSYVVGKASTASDPRKDGPPYKALPPGKTVVLGDIGVHYWGEEPQARMMWKEGKYLSNALILPKPAE